MRRLAWMGMYLLPCLGGVLGGVACDREEHPPAADQTTEAPPSAAVPDEASDTPTTGEPATGAPKADAPSAPDEAPDVPKAMAFENPKTEALGVLPEGVGIAVGQPAPDAALKNEKGEDVKLGALSADGPVLLVFYRGGWCPYCNFQIRDLTEAHPQFEKRGITPVAVSVDGTEETAKTSATYQIPFPVLSDPDLVAHRAFHVTNELPKADVEALKGYGIDLEKASGRDHHTIAIPSLFVIDKQGVVRWAHAETDYKLRPSTAQILAAIDGLEPPLK